MKKRVIFLLGIILFFPFIFAQSYKMEISTIPEDKLIGNGESIQIKVSLRDENNNLVSDNVQLKLQDLKEDTLVEKTIQSNIFEEIKLPENVIAGEGKIIATYKENEFSESFFIGENEKAKFEIDGEKLVVINIGNIKYDKKIYITIGETTGIKSPSLNIGEKTSYRLIAPAGVYNIKITDGQTTMTRNEVRLTGTGQVIGAIDETPISRSGITGGIKPDESSQDILTNFKINKFVYIFIATVFGAMILLTIEKQYEKKAKKR